MTDYDIVRAACLKANPDKECPSIDLDNDCPAHTIRLADVLLAMQTLADDDWNRHWVVNRFGQFLNDNDPKVPGLTAVSVTWNLRNDDLSQQSPETLTFLAGLLKPHHTS